MPKLSILKSKILKKILTSFAVFLCLFSISLSQFAPLVYAQEGTWYNQNYLDWYKKVYDDKISPSNEIFGERYTAAQVQWVIYGLISFPLNVFTEVSPKAFSCLLSITPGVNLNDLSCMSDVVDLTKSTLEILKISSSLNTNSQKIDPIAIATKKGNISGVGYIISALDRVSLVPEVNAQGFGYTEAISDLRTIWSGFLNISYALAVIAIMIFAFMVMFRVKINPQTVISIQSSIPKVIVAIALATFSYAIAGFVIDLSYVVGGLFASLVKMAGFETSVALAFQTIVPIDNTQALGGFFIFFWMLAYTILFLVASFIGIFGPLIGGASIFGTLVGVIMFLFTIWVALLMVWYTIKIPWILIKNLISLYLSIVVGPVQIVIGAIAPAIGFGMWLRKIIAEALVFPVTGLFMFFAAKTLVFSIAVSWNEIIEVIGLNIQSLPGNMWAPPILGSSDDMAGILWLAISFVFITMIPKAVDITKMLIMGAKFDFGTAIGEAIAPAQWGYKTAMGLPVARTFSEGFGYMGASRMLNAASERPFWNNVMNRTSWLTGINSTNAKAVAASFENRATQSQTVSQQNKGGRRG